MKKIVIVFSLFAAGIAGGILSSLVLIPYLATIPFFSHWNVFAAQKDQAVIVNKTEQIVIERQEVFRKMYEKNAPAVVMVKSVKNGNTLTSGAGVIVSADGLVLTRREWVPSGNNGKIMVTRDGNDFPAETVKTSDELGLVLVKIDASGLPVVSFAKNEERRLGSDVFLIGMKRGNAGMIPFMNTGVIKSIDGSFTETNIAEDFRLVTGTPLFTLAGDVIGINSVNSAGYVFAVSSDAITQFIY